MHPLLTYASETKRLKELLRYQILDTSKEIEFDHLVKITARIFDVPVAAITFIDENRQWIKASVGINVCESERKIAACNYTIYRDTINIIPDMRVDERFRNAPFVSGEPYHCFYAGIPLITKNGFRIGAFCIVDTRPRNLGDEEKELLSAFASNAMTQIEINLKNIELTNIRVLQNRLTSVLNNELKDPATIFQLLNLEETNEAFVLNTDLEELNGLLKKQADNTFGLLNEMNEWRKQQLQDAVNKIQNVSFKKLVNKVMIETEKEITAT